jgi:hypothetical protein
MHLFPLLDLRSLDKLGSLEQRNEVTCTEIYEKIKVDWGNGMVCVSWFRSGVLNLFTVATQIS